MPRIQDNIFRNISAPVALENDLLQFLQIFITTKLKFPPLVSGLL